MICLINLLYGSGTKNIYIYVQKNIYICEQILDAWIFFCLWRNALLLNLVLKLKC